MANRLVQIFKGRSWSFWALVFIVFFYFSSDMLHHYWMKDEPKKRGVIKHDIMGYYAYLPSIFIYGDYTLGFIDEPGFVNDNKFLSLKLDNGKRIIQYTSGLSIAYTPFFLMAHAVAPLVGEERDGFNWVYQFFLVMSALFYVSLALVLLRRLLLQYFTDRVTALSLLLLALGTNLYYYTVYESVMSHSYGFAFIAMFIFMVDRWYKKPSVRNTMLAGFLLGFTTLMRPTNIFVVLVLILWGVKSWQGLLDRVRFLLGKIPSILLMIVFFLLPWIPQLLYWKAITGDFFYNSYEMVGSAFYFDAPQTHKMLFSYRKGWFVYTPMMLVAFLGFYWVYRQRRELFWSFFPYMLVMIYVLSSWWAWWFGGGFGSRAMVDTYAIMAFPLAVVVENVLGLARQNTARTKGGTTKAEAGYVEAKSGQPGIRAGFIRSGIIALFLALLGLQLMQTRQYATGNIHYVAMDKEAYWVDYFKVKGRGIWPLLSEPDHQLARKGIYYFYDWGADYDAFRAKDKALAMQEIREEITSQKKIMRAIGRHARRMDMSRQEALEMVVERVYTMKSERQNLS